MSPGTGRLAGKRILITGAAGGIGSATAVRCAAEGATVVLVDVDDTVRSLADRLNGLAYVVDVTDPEEPALVVAAVVGQLGGVDALANVAGGSGDGGGDALGTSRAQWDRTLTLNVTATFEWIRAVIPAMAGNGSIVNVTSIAGTHALPQSVAYTTAKAALIGLTRSIAVDFGRRGVRCNAIAPGTIGTPGLERYLDEHPGVANGLLDLNFRGRLGTPGDVAELMIYLLGDESSFVNGETVAIDGGRAAGSVAAGFV